MIIKHKKKIIDPEVLEMGDKLVNLLTHYSELDQNAKLALNDLAPLVKEIRKGNIDLPLNRVPRGYDFHEGELRKYPELEAAYSSFAVRAKGYDLQRASEFMENEERKIHEELDQKPLNELIEEIRLKNLPVDWVYSSFMRTQLYVLVKIHDESVASGNTAENFEFHVVILNDMEMVVASEEIDLFESFGEELKAVRLKGKQLIDLLNNNLGISILLHTGDVFNFPPELVSSLRKSH
jgi:hypothetical protein